MSGLTVWTHIGPRPHPGAQFLVGVPTEQKCLRSAVEHRLSMLAPLPDYPEGYAIARAGVAHRWCGTLKMNASSTTMEEGDTLWSWRTEGGVRIAEMVGK